MSGLIPRLRMIAGPNGSGKTTIKSFVESEISLMWGIYINPDNIEKQICDIGYLDFSSFEITATHTELTEFFQNSALLKNEKLTNLSNNFRYVNGQLSFESAQINSYYASVIADFIRRKLLKKKISFTFETVMSSRDKIEFLKNAKENGYRTYLYYVATIDPEINIQRIQERVKKGGHDVPKDKILSRYSRSLDLLWEAIHQSDRTFIFDNSSHEIKWLAEITNGKTLEIKSKKIPEWFANAVINKISSR